MKIISFCTFICLFFLVSHPASAQYSFFQETLNKAVETDSEVKIEFEDGNTLIGRILTIGKLSVQLRNENGEFEILYHRIEKITILNDDDPTSGWYTNPAQNRLFITPSGRMLDAGDGYYQNTYIFFSSFTYGISKYLSLTGGFSMIPSIGIGNQLITLGAKIGTNISNNISISGAATLYKFDEDLNLGTIYAAGTYSKGMADFTAGLGVGINDGNTTNPLFILGGQFRGTERFAVLTENLLIPIDGGLEPIISLGGRFIGERITADLGFFTSSEVGAFVPFVSFAVKL